MGKTPDIFEGNPDLLKVAMCQIYTEEWSVKDNTQRVMEALEHAAHQGAELAITPECVLHGYGFSNDRNVLESKLLEAAEHIEGERMTAIRSLIKRLGINVVFGFAEKDDAGRTYNSAAYITNNGEVAYVYRKVHCRAFEDTKHEGAFTAGEHFFVKTVSIGEKSFNLGTMICFDREVPESVRCLRRLGAEFIACPLATSTEDMSRFEYVDNEMITRCRAVENEVFIAVVNHAGRFNGGSFIVGPGGEVLHQMGTEQGVIVVDVPVGSVRTKFHSNPLGWMGFGYRRPEVYRQYLDS